MITSYITVKNELQSWKVILDSFTIITTAIAMAMIAWMLID